MQADHRLIKEASDGTFHTRPIGSTRPRHPLLLVKEPGPDSTRCPVARRDLVMRTKTRTIWLSSALKLASHTAMGVAVGLAFSLILTLADPTGIMTLIDHSDTPEATLALFEGTIIVTFAIGATLTGLVFIMTEDGNA